MLLQRLDKTLMCLAVFTILACLAFIVPYVCTFGGFGFSRNIDHWEKFGAYFGGTLGPLLSFSAFMALLRTLYLQRKEFEVSNKQEQLMVLVESI